MVSKKQALVAASSAMLSSLGAVCSAEIIDIAPVQVLNPGSNTFNIVSSFDFDGDSSIDAAVQFLQNGGTAQYIQFIALGATPQSFGQTFQATTTSPVNGLATGTRSNTTQAFSNTDTATLALLSGTLTLGISLANGNSGWIQVLLNLDGQNEFQSFEILNGAFEDNGNAIIVGQNANNAVPEPSTYAMLGLLAAGAAGAAARRRKQKAKIVEAEKS